MVKEQFNALLQHWSSLLPGGVGGSLDEDRLRRAMQSAFELGVAARSHELVEERRDEHGQLLDFNGSAPVSNTTVWPCPKPGRYGLLFKAWQPLSGGGTAPTDAIVQFGWGKVDRTIQKYYDYWHSTGVITTFIVGAYESTVLTVISQDSPVTVQIQPIAAPDDSPLASPLQITLQANQATRRVLAYEVA